MTEGAGPARIRAWESQACADVRIDAVKIAADPLVDHWSADDRACAACGSLVLRLVEAALCAVCGRLVRVRDPHPLAD